MLASYTYNKDSADLINRLDSAGVPPNEVVRTDEVTLEYDHVLTPDEKGQLDQAMTDAGWAFASALLRVDARYAELQRATKEFIYSRYSPERQQTLAVILFMARFDNLVNRANYIAPAVAWVDTVFAYFYAKVAEFVAAPDDASLAAITWDFTALAAADPVVTIEQARSILD